MKHPRHGDVREAFLLCGIVCFRSYQDRLMRNFLFRTRTSYLRKELKSRACLWLHGHGHAKNMSKQKIQFSHLFVINLTFIFMWVQLMKNLLKIWKKKKLGPLTVDHSGDNEDSISFFHIFLPSVKYDHHQTYLYL